VGSCSYNYVAPDGAVAYVMNRKSNEDEGDGRSGRGAAWQWWMAAVLIIYALPFMAVMIDEKVLKTYWLYHHLPLSDGAADVLRTIYPFYRWFR
jgi:hypothetical protein